MVNSPSDTTTPPDDTGHLPLLDPAALAELLASLDHDEQAVDAFIATFISHWPDRLRRAEESITARDLAAMHDCALSIKVACQMVGAVRLGVLGGALEEAARSGTFDLSVSLLGALHSAGQDTLAALAAVRNRGAHEHAA